MLGTRFPMYAAEKGRQTAIGPFGSACDCNGTKPRANRVKHFSLIPCGPPTLSPTHFLPFPSTISGLYFLPFFPTPLLLSLRQRRGCMGS